MNYANVGHQNFVVLNFLVVSIFMAALPVGSEKCGHVAWSTRVTRLATMLQTSIRRQKVRFSFDSCQLYHFYIYVSNDDTAQWFQMPHFTVVMTTLE